MAAKKTMNSIKAAMSGKAIVILNLEEEINTCTNIEYLKDMIIVTDRLYNEVNHIQDAIADLEIEDHSSLLKLNADLHTKLRSVVRQIREKSKTLQKDIQVTNSNSVTNDTRRSILPTINLPTFNGDLSQYLSFWESFENNINSRKDLDDLDKFQYFHSLLRDKPFEFVRGYIGSGGNYKTMLEAFEKKYKRTNDLVFLHLDKIIKFPIILKKNAQQLQQLINQVRTSIHNLKLLGQPIDNWDAILDKLILDKLDPDTLEKFRMSHPSHDIPKYTTLLDFIEQVADSQMPNVQTPHTKVHYTHIKNKSPNKTNKQCPNCIENHPIASCTSFKKLDPQKRFQVAKKLNLCYNCLSKFHSIPLCKSEHRCKICSRRHHTLLHFDSRSNGDKNQKENKSNLSRNSSPTNSPSHSPQKSTCSLAKRFTAQSDSYVAPEMSVVMPTILISIHDGNKSHIARALIDSGSQNTLISESLAKKLSGPKNSTSVLLSGIVPNHSININKKVTFKYSPVNKRSLQYEITALVLKNLNTLLPDESFNLHAYNFLENLKLADPDFNKPAPIDLILGGKPAFDLLTGGAKKENDDGSLIAINSPFGWIVMGNYRLSQNDPRKTLSNLGIKNPPKKHVWETNNWQLNEAPNVSSNQFHKNPSSPSCSCSECTPKESSNTSLVKVIKVDTKEQYKPYFLVNRSL